MTVPTSMSGDGFLRERDFSLVLGGPLFQLLRRAHLAGDALELVRQRIIVISLFAWLPLLVLSALEGTAVGGSAAVPFLRGRGSSRPLPGGAAAADRRRAGGAPAHAFRGEGSSWSAIDSRERHGAVRCRHRVGVRLRNSVLAEVLLFAFVYVVGILVVWRQYMALDTATWFATPSAEGSRLSLAGMWFGYVSLPIFQFLLCRWYFRCSSGPAFSGRCHASS